MSELTIPVQIDSIKRLDEFQRTRCIYFRVEIEDGPILGPHPVSHDDRALLAAWGSWVVLAGPGRLVDADGLFVSPESIDQTLLSIEETEGLFLDLGYIWLPNELLGLQDRGNDVRKGDVYRLSTPFFRQCYRFAVDMMTEEEWLDSCKFYSDAIRPSPRETAAFREWRREQIKRSRDRYHQSDYADHRLPKKESEE
ncbi:MAG: hypothetical protein JSW47_20070 [Phycisphaerales bacterium]|nr:MAG: hypothetical protein JSW47_20070 [Phycisphaerales bacterium]